MGNNLYSMAVVMIVAFAEAEQARLDAVAAEARARHVDALRKALTGEQDGSAAATVRALLAQTVTVGREDGYPAVSVPSSTDAVVVAALQAGIKIGGLVRPAGRGAYSLADVGEKCADYEAWIDAREYRAKQTWSKL